MNITITRVDGAILINPAPSYITSYLQYSHRSFGFEGYRKVNKYEKKELYSHAPTGGVITFAGFFDKCSSLITREGDKLILEDMRTPVKEPDLAAIKDINWEGIGSTGLRDYQIDPVVELLYKAQHSSGIACAAGGYGKTILMACISAAFRHIGPTILAIPLKSVFDQTYDKFCKLFPNRHIGRVGDGYCDISSDITITTFKSLPKSPLEKCKLMLMDEIQGTTGASIVSTLSGITPVRMFGFTATDKNLFNGADKMIKGLFGERLIYVPYQDAESDGAVVPCKVYFVKVPDQAAFSAGTMDSKLLRGIKRNEVRNRLVGEVCRLVPEDWQTLVFVDHIADHLIPLYNFMPEGTTYVHRGQGREFGAFSLSTKKQDKNLEQYRNGEYQYLLATDCLRAGADIPQIKAVVQASGGTSEVEILQEAYRGARTAPGKTHFVLVDFMDSHDTTLENMSLKRMEIYKKQGWDVKEVNTPQEIIWDLQPKEVKDI
jgi:superfamily II DNA or RNA helicase